MTTYLILILVLMIPWVELFPLSAFKPPTTTHLAVRESPFVKLSKKDLTSNAFHISVGVAYKGTVVRSKHQCQQACEAGNTCVVAVHCRRDTDRPCFPGSPSCSLSVSSRRGTCHTFKESREGVALPDNLATGSCEYLVIREYVCQC